MSQIVPLCCCYKVEVEGSNTECQFRLCSPHPMLQMVIFSNNSSSDRFVPQQMMQLANQAVRELELDPSQVVWIEHTPARCNHSNYSTFNLVSFDWYAGQAISPHRSPIYEDWYLSWLENEFIFTDRDMQ